MDDNSQRQLEGDFDQRVEATFQESSNTQWAPIRQEPVDVTLLELVTAVTDVSDNEQEVIATVAHMLESGSITLRGCLRDEPRELFAV